MQTHQPAPRSPDDASRARLRVETPPPGYWRRWTEHDAPAPAIVAEAHESPDAPPVPAAPAPTPPRANPASAVEAIDPLRLELGGIQWDLPAPLTSGTVTTETIPGTVVAAATTDTVAVAKAILDPSSQSRPAMAAEPAPEPPPAIPGDAAVADESDDDTPSPYRVLIVEDDRSQALFAQSVLHGAGMQAEVQNQPDGVLEAIERFQPDLVLMDLHMPGQDGMHLTQSIRRQPDYLHLPVVFLTGDPDPERQYEVLESGADDFLTKPIRPRHLIAAVSNRILRARLRAPAVAEAATQAVNPETGLPTRTRLLERLGAAIREQTTAGLFFIEIAGAAGLRERLGYSRFEQLMTQAGRHLAEAAKPHALARLSDNNFLALAEGIAPAALEALAHLLRDALAGAPFALQGEENLRLRGVIGYTALPQPGLVDAGSALEATERAALLARRQSGDVAAHVPQASADDLAAATLSGATLELAFQPIVAVAGGDSAQYQVLLRMRQGDGTLLPAAQVVPAAEQSGRIVELDRQVMAQSLDLMAQRRTEGGPIQLFVSQSPRSLARDDAADWLLREIAARGVEPAALVIDLRLDDALIHTVTLRRFCQELMAAGVQFCLGQYEPGDEAEALLSQLPLAYLRVSRRYAGAHADPALRDQLREIIELAHRHGLQVIGQQVEDPQAAAAMWLSGVDFIQGNLVQGVGGDLGFDFQNAVL
ncbi:MAG: EAL domain-containing protein [Pseudoxanthomonas sp.]